MRKILIGIDWGGTFIKLGIFNFKGDILGKYRLSSQEFSQPSRFFKYLKKKLQNILKKRGLSLSRVKGMGIGVPGVINTKEGFIYYLPNIKGWENFPFKVVFEKEFGLPLALDNDANLFALAELKQGEIKGVKNAVLFTLGTGLGSGLVLGGEVFRAKTSSFEAGHFPVDFKGRKCGCGSKGCIETFLGSSYIVKKARRILRKKISSPKELYCLALENNPQALEIWRDFGYKLGVFSAGLINLLNLELIVLSGGIAKASRFFMKSLKEAIQERTMPPFLKGVKVKKSKLADTAGILGAYEFIKERLSRDSFR
ncbi:MAG: hypothetical protein DRP61_04465 [Candidatus Omnitrophota bacterium]|nr:MAG: hypothetical protein DRP61_04465 [Candidatus Omnitrophota bacterium]